MNLGYLDRRVQKLREQLPHKEPCRDLADLGSALSGQERLDFLAFIATVRDYFPGGCWSPETLEVAFPQMTQDERAEFRRWLVLAEEREHET